MATKSFLNTEQLTQAKARLSAPAHPPNGDERLSLDLGAREFSQWLGEQLMARLSSNADWLASDPIILGSWAREELSPKSDIDILFCGHEEAVRRLVSDFARDGLKLRYRMPEDPLDWTKGVEPFDVLALLSAKPVTPAATEKLRVQIERLRAENREFRKKLLHAMRAERKARGERYDSISNFLEPNLKFGPGGLRDLEQALVARLLFPERFEGGDHAFIVLRYYKTFFLLVRQRLHLSDGATDVLSAPEQKPISEWLGFKRPADFMREIQKGLSRVSFYADWAIAQAESPVARIRRIETRNLNTVAALFKALEEDPSILMQNRVRLAADDTFARTSEPKLKSRKRADVLLGRKLARILDPATGEGPLIALFRSRLIDQCLPEFKRIVGHVQHDQYHRFTVDAHLLQVLRELKRFRSSLGGSGLMGRFARKLSKEDWMILAFACLFHDIAKGSGGDHSAKGVAVASTHLSRFGKSKAFIREVCWLVEEHLVLSAAAFRSNPHSPHTWRALYEKGVRGDRIRRLAVFTVVDILGTNPEAWTSWKERLLFELANQLDRPETNSMLSFAIALKKAKVKSWERFIDDLDPFLIGSLPARVLVDDLRALVSGRLTPTDLPPKVVMVRGRGRQTWVRFHSAQDRPGLFLGFVNWLALSGLAVRHASIRTDAALGVYDWFEVKTSRSCAQVQKLITSATLSKASSRSQKVRFDNIELVSKGEKEWVISFRGRDQSGALAEAARVLFEIGAEIHWAKVHTWGRQIDDVFGIKALKTGPLDLVGLLESRLGAEAPKV